MQNPASLTGQYLTGKRQIPIPLLRRTAARGAKLSLIGARANNLKNVSVDIPLGTFTCVTGVSGGGKSTLIIETLYKALSRLNGAPAPGEHDWIEGLSILTRSSISTSRPSGAPRSGRPPIPAPSPHPDWFAGLPRRRPRLQARRFLNVKGGRCEARQATGHQDRDAFPPGRLCQCDTCKGKLQPGNTGNYLKDNHRRRPGHDGG
jgi:excinuclease ABC subunit A